MVGWGGVEGAWLENVNSSGVRQQCKPGLLWLPPQSDPGLAWGTSVGTCQARTRSAGVSRPAAGAHGAHARSADTPLVPAAPGRAGPLAVAPLVTSQSLRLSSEPAAPSSASEQWSWVTDGT